MSPKKQKKANTPPEEGSPYAGLLLVLIMTFLNALIIQEILSSSFTSGTLLSQRTWVSLVQTLGGSLSPTSDGMILANVPYFPVLVILSVVSALFLITGGFWISRKNSVSLTQAIREWGIYGWSWWGILVLWQVLNYLLLILGWDQLSGFHLASLPFWIAFQGAAWLTQFSALVANPSTGDSTIPEKTGWKTKGILFLACGAYVVIYTFMNWGLYLELLLPHGDSAMYEEHLWNLTHGKGFRSYLDQGLFWGEHIQFIHLFLIPFYLTWPSQMMMELSESVVLSLGAVPVFMIARRHSGSEKAALLLASAYLLYFPLQFLDIAIDLKTFRPIGFGVPVLLFALDQLERKRYKTMILLFLLALTAKEDYAIILAPLGLWIAFFQNKSDSGLVRQKGYLFGFSIAVLSTAYLLITVAVILPWFRSGVEIHYVGYFSQFGDSLGEVIGNILNPMKLIPALFNVNSLLYIVMILAPLGFLPLFSFSRFAVCLPLLMLLCLNQIAQDPRHHFHAPLIPILFWSASAGLKPFDEMIRKFRQRIGKTPEVSGSEAGNSNPAAMFLFFNSLLAGLFLSISPAGIAFWDSGSAFYWKNLYLPGKRAEMFARIENLIPKESRVASTDFVHPRFTHYERSYDYSNYSRAVNENQTGAPPDTDYIVIDTTHRYSEIKKPEDIPEYRDHPDEWELLPDQTDGYFIILKRKSS